MTEPDNDIINSSIEEYPNLRAIMQVSDLTSKKRIRSVRQYLHKNPVPAEVIDVDESTGIISVSRRYLKEIENKYITYYQDKLKLLNIVKNIQRHLPNKDYNKLVKNIIHPLMDYIYIKNTQQPPDIFNIIKDNIDSDDFLNFGECDLEIKSILNKMFREKPKKFTTKFKLICSISIKNIIELFTQLKNKYPKVIFKMESSPVYYFETFGLEEEQLKLHQEIMKYIKSQTPLLNISIQET